MAICGENLLNDHGLALYDSLIKAWVNSGITNERNARIEAINNVLEALSGETEARIETISSLTYELQAFSGSTVEELDLLYVLLDDLESALTIEISNREIADESILGLLSAETETRISEDNNILDLITEETENRISGDTAILDELHEYQNITNEQIDFLFGGSTKPIVHEDPEYDNYLDVSVSPKFANNGDTVTFTGELTPEAVGVFEFDGWYVDGVKVSQNTTFVTTFNKTSRYEAKLKALVNEYTISFVSNDSEMGSVYAIDAHGDSVTALTVVSGDDVTFTPYAEPNEDYRLQGWSGGLVDGQSFTLHNVQSDYTFYATFEEIIYHVLSFVANDPSMGLARAVSDGSEYTEIYVEDGDSVTFTPLATANDGYEFVEWSGGLLNNVETSVTPIVDITYVATFEESGGQTVETTYEFTTKSWGTTTDDWSSNSDGNQFQSGRGIQVTAGTSGANADSPRTFNNVSNVTIIYSTNASKSSGSIYVTIGDNEHGQSVTYASGGTTDRELSFDIDRESGVINLYVDCSTNSVYIKSITITHEE